MSFGLTTSVIRRLAGRSSSVMETMASLVVPSATPAGNVPNASFTDSSSSLSIIRRGGEGKGLLGVGAVEDDVGGHTGVVGARGPALAVLVEGYRHRALGIGVSFTFTVTLPPSATV